ncbi:MAG: PD-(D/E)XK nuclease family protein, partial [Bacteroidia bacterium]|nr:PD-(D/E)XK nuclease family protein [Bacteroidia bacterium]
NNNRNKSFQVLFYAYLYTSISKINNSILSGIISFRNLSAGIAQLKINNNSLIDNHHLLDFEKELIQLLKEILNPAIPFTKTKDINKCQYCAYKLMCNIKSK